MIESPNQGKIKGLQLPQFSKEECNCSKVDYLVEQYAGNHKAMSKLFECRKKNFKMCSFGEKTFE
jgi:hypothetical protein